ncbi:hypothetical protein CSC17_5164 [Klebsiella oxytoca]|nr:hypothetical protein CSC17_5164 [Klebsiella oxytoca]
MYYYTDTIRKCLHELILYFYKYYQILYPVHAAYIKNKH